jgi:hypothetical protein
MLLSRSIPKVYKASSRQISSHGALRFNRMIGAKSPISMDMPRRMLSTSFLSGSNSVYVDAMYDSWKADPSSVHASWNAYFANIAAGIPLQYSSLCCPGYFLMVLT